MYSKSPACTEKSSFPLISTDASISSRKLGYIPKSFALFTTVSPTFALIAFDINKSANFLNDNERAYIRFLKTQQLIREIDEIHIIDIDKKLLFTNIEDRSKYSPPVDGALELVVEDDRPLKIINAPENISAAIMRLQVFKDRFLYVVKYLDPKISNYLNESQEAINFYYTVEERSTGIKISFAIIYLIVVTLLMFISITIAIRFSSRFFRSINNLIYASSAIGSGDLDAKVPELKTDKDLETFGTLDEKTRNKTLHLHQKHQNPFGSTPNEYAVFFYYINPYLIEHVHHHSRLE